MKPASIISAALLCVVLASAVPAAELPNPFFAMDTSFERAGSTTAQQFDLVKELGFAGIAWHEESPEKATKASAKEMESRGLKMVSIYCAATVSPQGELSYSAALPKLIQSLKGHGTIIWLHIGGKGPAIESLAGDAPAVKSLRGLAETAASDDESRHLSPHWRMDRPVRRRHAIGQAGSSPGLWRDVQSVPLPGHRR